MDSLTGLDELEEVRDNLNIKVIRLKDLQEVSIKYKGLSNRLDQEKGNLNILNEDIGVLAEDYSKILKEIGRCPTCFGEIEEVKIDKIVKELKGD